MEILKRAEGPNDGEIIPVTESESNVRDEVNRRTWKAGYTDRDGQAKISRQTSYGKGDAPRPVNKKKFDENYRTTFGHD